MGGNKVGLGCWPVPGGEKRWGSPDSDLWHVASDVGEVPDGWRRVGQQKDCDQARWQDGAVGGRVAHGGGGGERWSGVELIVRARPAQPGIWRPALGRVRLVVGPTGHVVAVPG